MVCLKLRLTPEHAPEGRDKGAASRCSGPESYGGISSQGDETEGKEVASLFL